MDKQIDAKLRQLQKEVEYTTEYHRAYPTSETWASSPAATKYHQRKQAEQEISDANTAHALAARNPSKTP